jgi:hypothetical protein
MAAYGDDPWRGNLDCLREVGRITELSLIDQQVLALAVQRGIAKERLLALEIIRSIEGSAMVLQAPVEAARKDCDRRVRELAASITW